MEITSSAFANQKPIPKIYTCDGENISPPISFKDIPAGTESLVLMVDDPDAPEELGNFTHWIVWNIDPRALNVAEDSIPQDGIEGLNDSGEVGYIGPCPPRGEHDYRFRLFAMDRMLDLTSDSTRQDVEEELEEGYLEMAELVGTYKRGEDTELL